MLCCLIHYMFTVSFGYIMFSCGDLIIVALLIVALEAVGHSMDHIVQVCSG